MEKIETINQYLADNFGIDTESTNPIFRVVWSEDQFEKRWMKVTDSGVELLSPELRTVPKYRQWIQNKYVLERLVLVPDHNLKELAGLKKSYEPLWVFEDANGNPLPPRTDAAKFVIDSLYAAIGKKSMANYLPKDDPNAPITSKEELYEHEKAKVDELENQLFGDESGLKQSTLNSGQSIIVPENYSKGIH